MPNLQTREPGLFDKRLAHHRDDPDTSVDADARPGKFANRHHRIILDVIIGRPYGVTAREIEATCALGYYKVMRRLTELKRNHRIFDTGNRRQNDSGRSAIVWAHSFHKNLHVEG